MEIWVKCADKRFILGIIILSNIPLSIFDYRI